jgi:hypothetical protein
MAPLLASISLMSLAAGVESSDRRRRGGVTTITLRLQNTGQVNIEVISHDTNFQSATGNFGSLDITHVDSESEDAVGFFMDGIVDPSMYMRSPKIGSDNPPESLHFMMKGNLSARLDDVQADCGQLHIGKYVSGNDNTYWWLASPHCVKGLPPSGGKDGQYRFVCQCDSGLVVEFAQAKDDNLPMGIYDCTSIQDKAGQWVQIASSPGLQQITYSQGVSHSDTHTDSKTWGSSTTNSVSAGFRFMGFSASASVGHTTSKSFTKSHSSTFSKESSESYSTSLGPGTVWQFTMDIQDNCGGNTVQFSELQLTQSSIQRPCCLPGHFVNISDPTGECLEVEGEKYDVCDRNSMSEALV